MSKKIAFIIGAGSTYGDSKATSVHKKPPLDNKFFSNALIAHPNDTKAISKYLADTFNYDIFTSTHDRLEEVMAMLYSDIYHPQLGDESFSIFRRLVKLYNKRIAETTNIIKPGSKRNLFKLIAYHISEVDNTSDITFITFNQDIHIEKTFMKFETYGKYKRFGSFFNFPHSYNLENPVTSSPQDSAVKRFTLGSELDIHLKLYKLHGSLNWYSTHNTTNISRTQLFSPKRKIHITSKMHITTEFKLAGKKRDVDTFPIIIPPVLHKSSILHNSLKPLWTKAEKALKAATDIIIFGYSCPEIDRESANMVRRAITNNKNLLSLSVIDPNPKVVHRYLELLEMGFISYYKNVENYLTKS